MFDQHKRFVSRGAPKTPSVLLDAQCALRERLGGEDRLHPNLTEASGAYGAADAVLPLDPMSSIEEPRRPPSQMRRVKRPEPRARRLSSSRANQRPRLFSGSFQGVEPGARLVGFAAAVVLDEQDFRERLMERYGAMIALGASVREGFDQYDSVAVRIVSEDISNWLAQRASSALHCTPRGFEVVVERRAFA